MRSPEEEIYNQEISRGSQLLFYIEELQPYTNYTINIMATNDEGFQSSSEIVWQTTQTRMYICI